MRHRLTTRPCSSSLRFLRNRARSCRAFDSEGELCVDEESGAADASGCGAVDDSISDCNSIDSNINSNISVNVNNNKINRVALAASKSSICL